MGGLAGAGEGAGVWGGGDEEEELGALDGGRLLLGGEGGRVLGRGGLWRGGRDGAGDGMWAGLEGGEGVGI